MRHVVTVGDLGGAVGRTLGADPSTRHWTVEHRDFESARVEMPGGWRRFDAICLPDGFGALDEEAARSLLDRLLRSLGPGGRLLLCVPLGIPAAEGRCEIPASLLLRLAPSMSFVDTDALAATVVLSSRSVSLLSYFTPKRVVPFDLAASRADLEATGHGVDSVLYLHGDDALPVLATRVAPLEAEVDALIDAGREEAALAALVVGIQNHYKLPEVAHRSLYYPALDRQIERLSRRLEAACPDLSGNTQPLTDNTLVIATELYRVGGHSRLLEDVVREARSAVVVLTDIFARGEAAYHGWLRDALGDASVIVLPPQGLWARCRALRHLTERLRPARIVYFNHHQDPTPFVGTLGHAGSAKIFVHHADHHPSAGVTLPGMTHVDVTDELADTCSRELGTPAATLPLYVADEGRRSFAALPSDEWSVVTSGTPVKFLRDGELALHRIAAAALGATRGNFFHIGPMDNGWLDEIRSALAAAGIDPARFVAVGPVDSLWRALARLPANVYIGSAPVGGARAAIEVQGCGFPLAYHRPAASGSLVALESIYASPALGWSAPTDLPGVLDVLSRQGHDGFSDAARALYERRFSRARFREALGAIGVI